MGKHHDKDGVFLRRYPSGQEAWWVRFSWMGRDIKKVGGKTKEEAKKKRRAMLTDLERGVLKITPTAKDTLAAVLERYRPIGQRQRNYQKTKAFYLFWIAQIGSVPLRSLTPFHVEQGQQVLLSRKKQPATVNRYTDFLRHVLNREVRYGQLLANPVIKVTRLKEPEAPIYQYTEAQERILMTALGESGIWVRLAILSGLRQEEQFSIKKEWIFWQEGYIQIPTSKASRPRIVHLTGEIRTILKALCARHPESPYLFPSPKYRDRPLDPGNWYRRVFRPALVAANFPPNLKWHTLRHTFGSRLAALGVSAKQIQALGGWSTDRASSRYLHFHNADLLKVAERLSKKKKAGRIRNIS